MFQLNYYIIDWRHLSSAECLSEFIFSGVTVLLSLTVFQQSISDAMPVTSLQIPLLGKLTDDMD